MANMYPMDGPTKQTTSDAERRIYHLLKDKLDENYHVFHSSLWSSVRDDGTVVDGEADFIVVHPEHGIVIFEVKGGNIGYDGTTKEWTSVDRHGVSHKIKDPFGQARDAAHTLKAHLQRVDATKPYAKSYWLQYAAWFPDITWKSGSMPMMHIPEGCVLDRSSRENPARAIETILSRNKAKRTITPDALRALIDILAPQRTIKAQLRDQIKDDAEVFIQLKDDQYRKLEMMRHHPRITVRGAAGTGKTVIALEKARQLALQGFNVLFLCSNPALAQWIVSMVGEEPAHIQTRITVRNVEQLCVDLSGQAGLSLNDVTDEVPEELGNRAFQSRLATSVARSIAKLESHGQFTQFDAILVDEAQDIERPLWTPLYKLLRDKGNGKFIAFYDPAQRDGDDDGTPYLPNRDVHEIVLTDNCRNTQAIFRTAQEYYLGLELPTCVGPEGSPVVWFDPATPAIGSVKPEERDAAALEMVLDVLIEKEGISPREIIVVVGRSKDGSTLYRRRFIGNHLLSNHIDVRDPRFVRIITVRSAKGLESPVLVLAELDGIQKVRASQPKLYNRYMYMATSRAIHQLIVLSSPEKTLPLQPALSTTLLQL